MAGAECRCAASGALPAAVRHSFYTELDGERSLSFRYKFDTSDSWNVSLLNTAIVILAVPVQVINSLGEFQR